MYFWTGVLATAAILTYVTIRIWRVLPCLLEKISRGTDHLGANFNNDKLEKEPYSLIIPLPNFVWQTIEPLKIRPFKPKYHLTMGMQSCLSNKESASFYRQEKELLSLHLSRTPLTSNSYHKLDLFRPRRNRQDISLAHCAPQANHARPPSHCSASIAFRKARSR